MEVARDIRDRPRGGQAVSRITAKVEQREPLVFGSPAEIDARGTNFDFLSIYLTGAWNSNLNIEVEGFRSGTLLYDTTVVVSATIPTLFMFDYLDIDRPYFNSYGGQLAFGPSPEYNFVMDNMTIDFIPEPSTFLLAALGAVTLWASVKRERALPERHRHWLRQVALSVDKAL